MSTENHLARNQASTIPPEIPRRPSITIARPSSTNPAAVNLTNGTPDTPAPVPPSASTAAPRHERIREIYKNAWLKRLHTSHDKKGTPLVKRTEKWWVVFCVHDDVEAYLEFYSEPKMAQIHKPTARISLTTCLHISPSIVGQDNEFQFAVTLSSQVIYLAAVDWDQMLEWVESLQGKLREMNIISPKDNLYSKLPTDVRNLSSTAMPLIGAASTRDPNSPLPPPPNGVMATEFASGYVDMNALSLSQRQSRPSVPAIPTNDSLPSDLSSSASVYVQSVNSVNFADFTMFAREENSVENTNRSVSIIHIDSRFENNRVVAPTENNNAATTNSPLQSTISPFVVGTNNNATMVHIGFESSSDSSADSMSPALNHGSTSSACNTSYQAPCQRSPCRLKPQPNSIKSNSDVGINCQTLILTLPSDLPSSSSSPTIKQTSASAPVTMSEVGGSHDSFYEQIFQAATTHRNQSIRNHPSIINEVPSLPERQRPKKTERRLGPLARPPVLPAPRAQIKTADGNQLERNAQNRFLFLGEASSSTTVSTGSSNQIPVTGNSQLRPLEGGASRRDNPPSRPVADSERKSTKVQHCSTNGNGSPSGSTNIEKAEAHVPLKESQVMRLNLEINHPSGVQIVLRKKDCHETIAFVDYLGAVWIAGWKQQEHPVLYYAFHVGDQLSSIAGQKIQSSEDARKAIKMTTTHQVELIVRRLPHGKVFVLKRKTEGEPLGLVAVGNCSEISEVVPNGLAAVAGLSPKASSVDGQHTCNWVLTEINNRPLSLVARETEVRDRLNAVGKEISILVQPSDLVKHMKKQLKAMKGFKDYLVS